MIPTTLQETGQTALLYTAKCGDIEIVKILIGRGADIHATDKVFCLLATPIAFIHVILLIKST